MSKITGLPNPGTVPDYVSARTPKRLRELYLSKQLEMGAFLRPISIEFNPTDQKWYAWFVTDFDFDKEMSQTTEVD